MAMIVREEHRLPALRIGMHLTRSEAQVRLTAFCGREQLADPVLVSAEAIGIRRRLEPREYRSVSFTLPEQAVGPLLPALAPLVDESHPLWLQIDRSAGHLAVVPWEMLLHPRVEAPILRIPNFVVGPRFLEGKLVLAICASSPRAKTPFPVALYVAKLVELVQQAVPQGTRVHLFADDVAADGLAPLSPLGGLHEVTVHDPMSAERFGVGSTDRHLEGGGLDARLSSPWLRWMQHALGGARLDAAHFVCPGYFADDRGALALAHSPIEAVARDGTDPGWSHFVGARELMAFLDLTGAWAVALSAPHEDVWALGLRLLAENLAWGRPGPVLLHHRGAQDEAALGRAYGFLYAPDPLPPPRSLAISLHCHPKRLAALEEPEAAVETSLPRLQPQDLDSALAAVRSLAVKSSRHEAASAAPRSDPTWKVAAQVSLDQEVMRLPERGGAAHAGRVAAIQLLNELVGTSGAAGPGELPDLGRFLRTSRAQELFSRLRSPGLEDEK